MVNNGESLHNREALDKIFGALSDPIRRGILEQLAQGESRVSALAEPFGVSKPAISRHLRVLEQAGLVRRTRRGREHHIRVDPRPIEEAQGWIAAYARFWQRQFDAVEAYLEDQKRTHPKEEGEP